MRPRSRIRGCFGVGFEYKEKERGNEEEEAVVAKIRLVDVKRDEDPKRSK